MRTEENITPNEDKGKKLLEKIYHLFYSCLDDFQKEIIRERKLKSEKNNP